MFGIMAVEGIKMQTIQTVATLDETNLDEETFPMECEWSGVQILGPEFFPEA